MSTSNKLTLETSSLLSSLTSFRGAQRSLPEFPKMEVSATAVKDALPRQDYTRILESSELFFTTILMAYKYGKKHSLADCPHTFTIEWHPNYIADVKKTTELFRKKLIESKCQKPQTEIFLSYTLSKYSHHFEKPTKKLCEKQMDPHTFVTSLPIVLNALGIQYSVEKCENYACGKPIKEPVYEKICGYPLQKFIISWAESTHHTFLVTPMTLPEQESNAMERLFERRDITGDFQFLTSGQPVKLHKCILDISGGELFEVITSTSSFAESDNNEYCLRLLSQEQSTNEKGVVISKPKVASQAAAKLLVRYMYLGHHQIMQDLLAEKDIPKETVFELLELAHMYDLSKLFDCACNVLSACATPDDIPQLLQYAGLYKSKFLYRLTGQLWRIQQGTALIIKCFSQRV